MSRARYGSHWHPSFRRPQLELPLHAHVDEAALAELHRLLSDPPAPCEDRPIYVTHDAACSCCRRADKPDADQAAA